MIKTDRQRRQTGMTLIELMVALAIGSFLLIGAVTVFMQGRQTFRITESVSRLQENARFALDAIEPDIRMSNYWGLTARTTKIRNRAGAPAPRVPDISGPDTCGADWTIDLDNAIDATNDVSDGVWPWDCLPNRGAVAGADTLLIRRVGADAVEEADLVNSTLYVVSARFQDGAIFDDATIPNDLVPEPGSEDTVETRRLIVNGYYVDSGSVLGNDVPSLRVKTLTAAGTIVDEEVLPGVEDMQIQFGVDTNPLGSPTRGSISRYVNPGDAVLAAPSTEVLAVRIWLRLRAERLETGYQDTTNYAYADRNQPAPNDGLRRVVVSKTIFARNARAPI